jgi:hypothetical protein
VVPPSGTVRLNVARMGLRRELGLGGREPPGFSHSQRLHLSTRPAALPAVPSRLMDDMDSRA